LCQDGFDGIRLGESGCRVRWEIAGTSHVVKDYTGMNDRVNINLLLTRTDRPAAADEEA